MREQSLVIWKVSAGTCNASDVRARPRFVSHIMSVLSSAPDFSIILIAMIIFIFKISLFLSLSLIRFYLKIVCYGLLQFHKRFNLIAFVLR